MDKNREHKLKTNDRLLREAMLLRRSRQPELPEGLEDSIMNSIGKRRNRKVWLYAAVAAAAAILLLVVLMIPHTDDTPQKITAGAETVKKSVEPSAKADKPTMATIPTTKSTGDVYAKAPAVSHKEGKKESRQENHAVKDNSRQASTAVSQPSDEPKESFATAAYSVDMASTYDDDGPADPLTMFIETSADNAVLSSNSRRMAGEMGMDI